MTANDPTIKNYKKSEDEETQLGKETAARFSKGKVRHDLIPPWVIDEIAKVYTYGTIKYDDNNWWKGLDWSENVIGPLERHLNKWLRGEIIDDESNCHHLAMVIWQCICLMCYERFRIGNDDRVPFNLDMMNKQEQIKRVEKWSELARKGRLEEYNGLNI